MDVTSHGELKFGNHFLTLKALLIYHGAFLLYNETQHIFILSGEKMKKTLFIAVLSLLFIGGCQTDNQTNDTIKNKMTNTDNHQLTETQWQLIQFDQQTIKKTDPQTELPYFTLQEKDNRVFGLAGCNRFFGSYKQTKNQLSFSQFGMTMMACYDLPIAEHQFIQALEQTDNYAIKGNRLTIKQGDKPLAVFQATEKVNKQ